MEKSNQCYIDYYCIGSEYNCNYCINENNQCKYLLVDPNNNNTYCNSAIARVNRLVLELQKTTGKRVVITNEDIVH